jgi:hypothetical protein
MVLAVIWLQYFRHIQILRTAIEPQLTLVGSIWHSIGTDDFMKEFWGILMGTA